MSAPHIRLAKIDDLPRLTSTLTDAFEHYVFLRHTLAADNFRERLRQFNELFLRDIGMPYGRVWLANDGEAVAIWTTPASQAVAKAFRDLAPTFETLSGDRIRQSRAAHDAMQHHRPDEPVWFLGSVGVDPTHQGKGLGRAVIQPGMDAAEQAGVPAFLETSEPGNVRFYEKLGFGVTAEYDLPNDGPRMWSMVRSPNRRS